MITDFTATESARIMNTCKPVNGGCSKNLTALVVDGNVVKKLVVLECLISKELMALNNGSIGIPDDLSVRTIIPRNSGRIGTPDEEIVNWNKSRSVGSIETLRNQIIDGSAPRNGVALGHLACQLLVAEKRQILVVLGSQLSQ